MKRELLTLLACPRCAGELTVEDAIEAGGEIESGRLHCAADGGTYAITGFIPRFVDSDQYVASFSKQRQYVEKHFDQYTSDRSGDQLFLPTTGFDAAQVSQGLSLEIGCGYGRFVDTVQRMGGTVVGVDLSTDSINLAQRFVGLRPHVHLVQADLFHLPFRPGTFDHVFSIGVLHHAPDTQAAFASIVRFAKPNGQVAIWVYHPRNKVSANRWRKVTTKLPHPVTYAWCVLNQALFSPLRRLPGGELFNAIVPGATPRPGRPFWLRVLSDFDSLSPWYAHVHDESEVRKWFEDLGLEFVRVLPRATAVSGRVPARASTATAALNRS
jgi:ubiquinone/menaquinone biosynthesis C-methylase UbiE